MSPKRGERLVNLEFSIKNFQFSKAFEERFEN